MDERKETVEVDARESLYRIDAFTYIDNAVVALIVTIAIVVADGDGDESATA